MLRNQRSILSFWRDIEIFSLPELPLGVKKLDLDKILPWELPFTPEKNSTWRHTIFFGKHTKENIINVIDKITGSIDEKPDWLDKPTGNTCMAILILNEQGQLAGDNSYLQASYLHGIKCLQEKRPLTQVNKDLEQVQEAFKERYPYHQEADSLEEVSSPQITKAHLKKEIAVLNDLNITDVACDNNIYVQSIRVSKLVKADTAFLNSFYLDDLNRLINTKEALGKGLNDYLSTNVSQEARIDLLTDANAFLQTIDPALIPAGRWPSNPSYGLYTAQVGAVNTTLKLLDNDGIIGVNGPPGTGKTTLLADIVADVIVTRARKLIKKDVSGLFGTYQKIEKETTIAYHYPANADVFNDAGIIVASNNNAAVENISKELPDELKIHRTSFPDAGYFTGHAQNLIDGKSWGILAAALGNSENRSFFKNSFWYKSGEHEGFSAYLQGLYNNPENQDHTVEYIELYRKAKTELECLLKEFHQFKDIAVSFYQLLPVFLSDQKLKVSLEHNIVQLTDKINNLNISRSPMIKDLSVNEKQISEIQYNIHLHNSIKPIFFFFQRVFNTKTFKNWNEVFVDLYNEYTSLAAKRTSLQIEVNDIGTKISRKEKDKNDLQKQLK